MHINGHLWLDHRGISGPEWKAFLSGSNELSSLSWAGQILPCSTPSKDFILSSDTCSPLVYFWPFSQLPTWSHNSAHAQYIMIGTRASLLLIEFFEIIYIRTLISGNIHAVHSAKKCTSIVLVLSHVTSFVYITLSTMSHYSNQVTNLLSVCLVCMSSLHPCQSISMSCLHEE